MKFIVQNRVIRPECEEYLISHNSDYEAEFVLDDEWSGKVNTVRFVRGDSYNDVVLADSKCTVPPFPTGCVSVGLYNDEMTTTPATIWLHVSIKDGSGTQAEPEPDVYSQIISLIESGMLKGEPGEPGEKGDPGEPGEPGEKGEGITDDLVTLADVLLNDAEVESLPQGTTYIEKVVRKRIDDGGLKIPVINLNDYGIDLYTEMMNMIASGTTDKIISMDNTSLMQKVSEVYEKFGEIMVSMSDGGDNEFVNAVQTYTVYDYGIYYIATQLSSYFGANGIGWVTANVGINTQMVVMRVTYTTI